MSVLATSDPAHAEDRAAAEQLFRIGADAYRAQKYDAAVENFERAYEQFRAPEIAFSAAQAHRLQYGNDRAPIHVKRAIALFEAYIAAAPTGNKRKDAEAHLARLRDVLSGLGAAGQVGENKQTPSIIVSVGLDTALITLDGKAIERYTTIDVTPGEHVVAVSADGYVPIEKKVTVVKGQANVPIELVARPASVTLKTQADARVVVDGRAMASTGALEIAAGKRWITVWARGREPVTRELDLRPGQDMAMDIALRPTARRKAVPWVWVGAGGLLAASVATATVAFVSGNSAATIRDSADPIDGDRAQSYERLRNRRDTYLTTSVVLAGASLLAAGAALYLYYGDKPATEDLGQPGHHEHHEGGFTPMASLDGIGLAYRGGW